MFLLENEYLFDEAHFHFPSDKNDQRKIDDLSNEIRDTKEKLNNMSDEELMEKADLPLTMTKSALAEFSKGIIMGGMNIPFALLMTLLIWLTKKLGKLAKEEADKRLVTENLKMDIQILLKIKRNNKDNKNIEEKVDKGIDVCNDVINDLVGVE